MANQKKSPNHEPELRPLLEAVAFAARAHRQQLRKDGQTPYVSHVFRVCLIVRHVFGVEDLDVLKAALLHDTIEDTTTDFDDVNERFGTKVAEWVAALTKDKSLIDAQRETAYCKKLSESGWQVRLCKLADIYDNLTDSSHLRPEQRPRTLERSQRYLNALYGPWPKDQQPSAVELQAFERAYALVARLHAEMKA